MSKIIFKCLKTPRNYYVYDRHTNAIFSPSENEYKELRSLQFGEISPEECSCLDKYQKQGLLMPNVIKTIRHSKTDDLKHMSENRLTQLTLQVTQQCNLRCSYCIYSGSYDSHRVHQNKSMSFETAKKSIDFFLARTKEQQNISIGFYGGEPLLEFDLVKQCIDYINSIVEYKQIFYTMTTNGTLLKGSVLKDIMKYNIHVSISLDGSKEEHDANRKFANGAGSFDVVMKNVREFDRLYPGYVKDNVLFLTVINPRSDLGCALEFFKVDDVLQDCRILFSPVRETEANNSIDFNESSILIRRYEYLKLMFALIKKLDSSCLSKLVVANRSEYDRKLDIFRRHVSLKETSHPGGPCMPGIRRLFVTSDGRFFPCERVNEENKYFCIGSLNEGFDYEAMERILNNAKVTEDECKECWAFSNCKICSNDIDFKGEHVLCKEAKLPQCRQSQIDTFFDIYDLCVLREFGYEAL